VARRRGRSARAQQARPLPRIGYLSVGFGNLGIDAFREGLRDFGYVEGQNVLVEYRRADEPGQLDGFAAELIARKVEIIICGGSQATRAALQQTKTLPIVTLSSNPVAVGFVASLANPGGNVTGVSLLAPEVAGKRLQLFKELIPNIARVAVLWNPDDPTCTYQLRKHGLPLQHWRSPCKFWKHATLTPSMAQCWRH
jgi:putative ABC transport system substrate-binding protein